MKLGIFDAEDVNKEESEWKSDPPHSFSDIPGRNDHHPRHHVQPVGAEDAENKPDAVRDGQRPGAVHDPFRVLPTGASPGFW